MKVVLLAGGFGTRISEESQFKPKPMVEIGGQPILWHIMKEYSYYGFHDFIRFRVRGRLPRDKEKMLSRLNEVIGRTPETELYSYVQGECPALERCEGGAVWKYDS